jgi:nucleotide-binding universal stress UspA family protein
VTAVFNRILVATDRTESGDAAVSFTAALAREHSATVRVVHVNELLVGGRGFAAETELEAMDVVDRAVARLRGAAVDADGVHFLANCFTVADRIAEAAQAWGADVIVFGSKRRRRFARFGGLGLRERVTAVTGLPTLTAPAALKVPKRIDTRRLLPLPASADEHSGVS